MKFKEYLDEKKTPKVNPEKMSDEDLLKFYATHKKTNFTHLGGNVFTSLIDEIKLRKLTRKLTNRNLAKIGEGEEPMGITVYRALLAKELKTKPKFLEYVDKDKHGYYFNVKDPKSKHYNSTRLIKRRA